MADNEGRTGFFGRLFGRKSETPAPETPPADKAAPEPAEVPPSEPVEAPAAPAEAPAPAPAEASPEPEAPPVPEAIEAPVPPEPAPQPAAPEPEPAPEPQHEPEVPGPGLVQPEPAAPEAKASWWTRLKQGLSRSSSSIGQGISDIFTKRKLDAETLEDLEDVLIRADLGVVTASRIAEAVGQGRYDKAIDPAEVRSILSSEVEKVLAPVALPLVTDAAKKPYVILVVGVNGSGKTTTIGKLAAKLSAEGKKVMLAAGDTFRAAAIEQLEIWGSRVGARVISRQQGADAAGLAFDAINDARAEGADVLIMDTAGRLQNRKELMDELEKVVRVMRKVDPEAPHASLLVIDATVGQNALSQVEIFGRVAGVTGLVMTKLDGTARGGILVAISEKHKLPVHFIGVGEGVDDLEPFAARDFARAIAGIED